MTRGWTCPRCRRVWAPSVQGCQFCNGQVVPSFPNPYIPDTITPSPYTVDITWAGYVG